MEEMQLWQRLQDAWGNVGELQALAGQLAAFPDVANIVARFTSGTLTEEEAREQLRQLGLVMPRPQGEFDYDPQAMRNAISLMWTHLGIDPVVAEQGALGQLDVPGMPQWIYDYIGAQGGPAPFSAGTLGLLGFIGTEPKLFRDLENGVVYVLLSDGALHQIASAGLAGAGEMFRRGLDPTNVIGMSLDELKAIAPFGQPMPITEEGNWQTVTRALRPVEGSTPPLRAPLREPLTGMLLPPPEMLAEMLPRMDSAMHALVLAAYDMAGMGAASVERRRLLFTPTGTAQPGGVYFG